MAIYKYIHLSIRDLNHAVDIIMDITLARLLINCGLPRRSGGHVERHAFIFCSGEVFYIFFHELNSIPAEESSYPQLEKNLPVKS